MPEIAASAAPDWEAITHDVLCPLCAYNLRGLSEARCPECGYRFEWVEVTDPKTRPHAYLFEHHPERNVRSFLQTIWGTLRPIKFWRSMSPAQPSRPRRLFAYWFVTTLLTLPFLGASWLSAVVSSWDDFTYTYVRRMRGFIPVTRNSTEFSWSHLWENMKRTWAHSEIVDIALFLTLFWIAWPLLMLCALSIFQISMTQAKIRSIHVLRCLIYTYDIGAPLAWLGAAAILLSIWLPQLARWRGLETQQLLMLALLVLVTFRLWVAYRCYLRFRHALATVVLSQIVGILFAMALSVIFEQIVSEVRHW